MHPADAIIDRIEQVLQEQMPEFAEKVQAHRTLSLSEVDREVPALIVTMGSDDPSAEFNTQEQLGSLLTVFVSIVDTGTDEKELAKQLLTHRRDVHRALMRANALDFDWVIEIGYLGAAQPSTSSAGAKPAKELTTRWQVLYVFNRDNPDV